MGDVSVLGDGSIPLKDIPFLLENGIKAIFGSGTPIKEITSYIRSQVKRGADAT